MYLCAMPVSVVIITNNEEARLPRTLSQLHWCDDIIVIDSFSQDATQKIAADFGCRVIQQKFEGYGAQKNTGIDLARHDWILSLDADEVLSDELINEIKVVCNPTSSYSAFSIPIRNVFLGREFKHGKESAFHHVRLFRKGSARYNLDAIHEKLLVQGKVAGLKGLILHYSYVNLSHFIQKMNAYTDRAAQAMALAGKSTTLVSICVKAPFYLIKHYILYGNWKNGRAGLIWSWMNAWYHTLKYLKLLEYQHATNSQNDAD